MVRSHLMRGLRLCGLGGQLVNGKSHGGDGWGDPCPGLGSVPSSMGNLRHLSDPSFRLLIYNEWLG